MLTRPRGSRKATFASLDTALNDLKASASDSEFVLLKVGAAAFCPPSLEGVVDMAVAGLNSPVHSFGVVQAFGAAAPLLSSVGADSPSALVDCVTFSSTSVESFTSSVESPDAGLTASRDTVLGNAGITGTVTFWGFGAIGVVSPPTGMLCCIEDGVVGLVDSSCSDAGWLVVGVSGRGMVASAVVCWFSDIGSGSEVDIVGSSTGSPESCVAAFRFLRALLAGQGRSGLDSQGNWSLVSVVEGKRL